MASGPNNNPDEISIVCGNDERASRGYLMLIRGPISARRDARAVEDAISMIGDEGAVESARRPGLR
jgi:hypothetical protein